MTNLTERGLGYGFGLLGGVLLLVGSLVSFLFGVVDLATGHPFGALAAATLGVLWLVIGALALFFAYLGYHGWSDRPLASAVLLVVLAVVGWAFLGLGANVVVLVGGLFALLGGVLFLVQPAKQLASSIVTA